mmetsp:Transcript_20730/g.50694  ORF Transcript_20730/g.50694 Transcript_20730/m.50694 type:complete len:347 (-) Transcript_20730:55-1095(-)
MLAPVAYATSRIATHKLVQEILQDSRSPLQHDLRLCVSRTRDQVLALLGPNPGTSTPPSAETLLKSDEPRAALLDFADQSIVQQLRSSSSSRDNARLHSVSGPEPGAFLHALPLRSFGLRIHPQEFRTAVGFRLGLPLLPSTSCPACENPQDALGDHSVSCSQWGDRTSRHNLIGRVIGAALAAAGHTPRYEDPRIVPTRDRPADISTSCWSEGVPTAFDITVVSPTTPSHVLMAAKHKASTASAAEALKSHKYAELCRQQQVEFWPVAFETFGSPGPSASRLIRDLGQRLAARQGLTRSEGITRLRQQISVGIARSVATMIINRQPPPPNHIHHHPWPPGADSGS